MPSQMVEFNKISTVLIQWLGVGLDPITISLSNSNENELV